MLIFKKIDHIMDKVKLNNVTQVQVKLINDNFSNQYSFFILLMILTAFPVGFFAGLFGIGGGLITVPFFFFIFENFKH